MERKYVGETVKEKIDGGIIGETIGESKVREMDRG